MKKLKLSNFDFTEILSREELKKIVGGDFGSGSGSGSAPAPVEVSPKVKACQGKKEGDYCVWSSGGTPYAGYCRSFMTNPLHCSDLM